MISLLDQSFFRRLGQYMINRIREDMSKGISQNPDGNMRDNTYSKGYAKYKRNGMYRYSTTAEFSLRGKMTESQMMSVARFVNAGGLHTKLIKTKKKGGGWEYSIKGSEIGKTKKGYKNKNKRIDGYEGVSISSTETSFVNLELTGKLKQGLKIKETTDDSVTLSYRQEDIGKILGAESLGRSIVGLNDKNKDLAVEMIKQELSKKGYKKFSFELKVNVNLKI